MFNSVMTSSGILSKYFTEIYKLIKFTLVMKLTMLFQEIKLIEVMEVKS